jgi:hypothetical protein
MVVEPGCESSVIAESVLHIRLLNAVCGVWRLSNGTAGDGAVKRKIKNKESKCQK